MSLRNARLVTTLAVTDLKRAREFYEGLLGLEEYEAPEPDKEVFYRLGQDSYLYLYQRSTPAGSTATVCAFSVDDVKKTVDELRRKGATFEDYDIPEMGLKTVNGVANVDGVTSAWLKDPSGNIVAIDDALAVVSRRRATGGARRDTELPAPH